MISSQLVLDTIQEVLERKEDMALKGALVLIQRMFDEDDTIEVRMSDRVNYNKIAVFHVKCETSTVQPVLNNWFDIDTLYGLSDEFDDAIDMAVLNSMMERLNIGENDSGGLDEGEWEKIQYMHDWEDWAENRYEYDY